MNLTQIESEEIVSNRFVFGNLPIGAFDLLKFYIIIFLK